MDRRVALRSPKPRARAAGNSVSTWALKAQICWSTPLSQESAPMASAFDVSPKLSLEPLLRWNNPSSCPARNATHLRPPTGNLQYRARSSTRVRKCAQGSDVAEHMAHKVMFAAPGCVRGMPETENQRLERS